jgi:dihydroorotate dehydrogenase electron transfer subunit
MSEPIEKDSPLPSTAAATSPNAARCQLVSLLARQEVGRDQCVLRFSAEAPVTARSGQFAMLHGVDWGSAPLLPRPMSLLSGGTEPSFLVKAVGEGTRRLIRAAVGARFTLLAPLGRPWVHPSPGAQPILVAGGVGLPPLLFLARELAAATREPGAPAVAPLLLYGGRTAEDLPLAHEADAVAELRTATENGSRGSRGQVTALLEPALDDAEQAGRAAQLYTCGPHAMMAAVARLAAERGLRCQVSLETGMACGYGVCLGCATARAGGGYLYACNEGPCVDAAALDWQHGDRP